MATLTAKEAQTLKEMDADVRRIQKVVRVNNPYFMTSAGSYASRHHKHPVEAWLERKDTPFEQDEDHLQYVTWVFRENAGIVGDDFSCVILHGYLEEMDRRKKKARTEASPSASTSNSSNAQTPKVRLSLQEYRKRREAAMTASPALKPTVKSTKTHQSLAALEQTAKLVNGEANPPAASSNSGAAPSVPNDGEKRGVKRTLDDVRGNHHDNSALEPNNGPTKKLRTSPQEVKLSENETTKAWRNDLPDLLSPAEDPKKNPPHGLQPLLSPLPHIVSKDFYEDFLSEKDKLAEGRAKKAQSLHDQSGAAASDDPATPLLSTKNGSKVSRQTSPAQQTGLSDPKRSSSLIVKLKYGRKRRKAVENILRQAANTLSSPINFSEKPQLSAAEHSESRLGKGSRTAGFTEDKAKRTTNVDVSQPSRNHNSSSTLASPPSSSFHHRSMSKSSVEKRKRADDSLDDSVRVGKNREVSMSEERSINPRTPNNRGLFSPATGHRRSESQKSLFQMHLTPTPLKDARSANMARTISQESVTSTPATSQPTPIPSNRSGPTSVPAVNGVAVDVSHLNKLDTDMRGIGKRLKTAFNDIQNRLLSTSHPTTSAERKLGAVLGLESLLAYMVAFAAEDARRRLEKRGANFGNWVSMRRLFEPVLRLTGEFLHLDGLQHHIGVAICNRVVSGWADRDLADRAKHPDVINNALVDGQTWSADAWNKLSMESIMQSYPKTWDLRARVERAYTTSTLEDELGGIAMSLRDGNDISPGKFWLPLAADSGPLQAVRFALSILKEFADREGLAYEATLKI